MGLIPGRTVLLLAVGASALLVGDALAAASRPYAPPDAGSLEELDLGLAQLGQHRRLLLVGAHPDDESGALLAHVTFGLGGEATYLSLTRGEGGQNRLGPELGAALGALRTAELLAARQIDHARQLFSRAIDFGYSRSFDEALDRWPEEELLRDVVRAIRLVRPQVVVAVFPPTAQAGHAQHQMSGHLARLGFSLASDPAAFPELAAEGLSPHAPVRLLQLAWWEGANPTFTIDVAALTPSGRSVAQLGRASRSRHRSQGMGSLEELGPARLPVEWTAGGVEAPGDLFDGVDTRLVGIAGLLEEPLGPQVEALLENVELLAAEARAGLAPSRRGAAVPLLAEILETLLAAERRLEIEPSSPATEQVHRLLAEKRQLAEELLASAAGLVFDARTTEDEVLAGAVLEIELELWNAGGDRVVLPEVPLVLWSPAGWTALAGLSFGRDPQRRPVAPGELLRQSAELRIASDAGPSIPYFLRQPPVGDLYDWSQTTPEERGRPFGPPPLLARLTLEVAGSTVRLERPVVARRRDRELGEVRRPLRLVPAIEVDAAPDRLLFRRGDEAPRQLLVTLRSHAASALGGVLEATVPPGWPAIEARPFALAPGERSVVRLALSPPAENAAQLTALPLGEETLFAPPAASGSLSIIARRADGQPFDLALRLVDYPHVEPQSMPHRAAVSVGRLDLALPDLGVIGYVRGGADTIPEALAEVGISVELLDRAALLDGDLSRFDAIVVGGVAYETEPALAEANPRLERWVRDGGLLLVQYQRRPFFAAGWGLLPFALDGDPDRVTDETALPLLLHPEHPLWQRPNQIGAADWEGWVQERGLYFPSRWDAAFEPQLSLTGALGEEVRGGLLVAPLGRGLYVYTGLAFFRQLPAGVPGAFRLFANLLALAAEVPAEAVDSGT